MIQIIAASFHIINTESRKNNILYIDNRNVRNLHEKKKYKKNQGFFFIILLFLSYSELRRSLIQNKHSTSP